MKILERILKLFTMKKKIKILKVEALTNHPSYANRRIIVTNDGCWINIIPAATGNCQSFILGYGMYLGRPEDKMAVNMDSIFATIRKETYGKKVMLMDVRKIDVKDIKKNIKPYTESFNATPYTNTNNTAMATCVVILNDYYHDLKPDKK
jgi:hypothetical protein